MSIGSGEADGGVILSRLDSELLNFSDDRAAHQRQLAKRLGVAEQQVQRWEANEYSGVGIGRLQEIADTLGVQTRETITYSGAA